MSIVNINRNQFQNFPSLWVYLLILIILIDVLLFNTFILNNIAYYLKPCVTSSSGFLLMSLTASCLVKLINKRK